MHLIQIASVCVDACGHGSMHIRHFCLYQGYVSMHATNGSMHPELVFKKFKYAEEEFISQIVNVQKV